MSIFGSYEGPSQLLHTGETFHTTISHGSFAGPFYGSFIFQYPCNLYLTSHRVLLEDIELNWFSSLFTSPLVLIGSFFRDKGVHSIETSEVTSIILRTSPLASNINYESLSGSAKRILFHCDAAQKAEIQLLPWVKARIES
ncbi:MAG: hypothetical protein M3R52_13180 [Acidobacteriota bacterium]|nr:hypothetical protein [Acidobacteriota bacterium]